MKKFLLPAFLCFTVLTMVASATTVQFGAGSPSVRRTALLANDSTAVPAGSLVFAGLFTNSGSFTYNPALSVLANVSAMQSDGFQPFGFTSAYNSGSGTWTTNNSNYDLTVTAGDQVASVSGIIDNTSNANSFNGSQVYLVIFNGTTVAASTQMGVFTSSSWAFPTNTGGGSDIATFTTTTTATAVSVVGGAGSTTGTVASGSPGTLVLAAAGVPEPTSVLALIGGGGLLAMLRRRRSE